jgi:hypothetical protein
LRPAATTTSEALKRTSCAVAFASVTVAMLLPLLTPNRLLPWIVTSVPIWPEPGLTLAMELAVS